MLYTQPIGKVIKFIAGVVAVDVAARYATKKGKELHEHVQNKGGYRQVFGNQARLASINVERTVHNVRRSLADLAEQAEAVYYEHYITDEERKTTYKGIWGCKFTLRKDFEACRLFREEVMRRIPENERFRDEIIRDVGDNVIKSYVELIRNYLGPLPMCTKESAPLIKINAIKESIVSKYFTSKI
jgi:hypothetical protein